MTAAVSQKDLANAIRALSMDAVQAAKSGHPGMPMGMADVATVLYTDFLKFDAADPKWPDRDRFVLSAGHGSMLLYSLLHLTGHADMPIDQLRNFRQLGSRTAGHPEFGEAAGIETTTGPLGQGIATAVGMALAERMQNARYGDDIVDHFTYVIAGDGCLMEGISQEAISFAGHLQLNKLIVLWDDNGITIDGSIDLSSSEDQIARFKAAGWDTDAIDGHDADAIRGAITKAQGNNKPTLIACKTTIGYGSPNKGGTSGAHGSPLGDDEIALTRETIGWSHEPFVIPADVKAVWEDAGRRGAATRDAWQARLDGMAADQRALWDRTQDGDLPEDFAATMNAYKKSLSEEAPKVATRVASQNTLAVINGALPETAGGSADLTGSNNTKAGEMDIVAAGDFSGRYIHYGIREHGMAAAMNGIALHGGLIPYGGTFLVFTDYCRPAIRLSAIMNQRVVYVMTHDSIGLGEDGPTHQPVEHLAALRAMPNVAVMRPADAVETAECWQLALENKSGPAVLALTRQNLPTLRTDHTDDNLCSKGAYVLRDADEAAATLIATGSEVEIAMDAATTLSEDGINVRVVSAPCFELFAKQDAGYRASVLGNAPRIGIEAAIGMGWERWLGDNGSFIGMNSFGASGPYQELYNHFGITSDAVVAAVKSL